MIQSLEQEYKMLSKLRHKRIVSYLGVCYEKHPSLGKECLFVMTEFMPGVSSSTNEMYIVGLLLYVYTIMHCGRRM